MRKSLFAAVVLVSIMWMVLSGFGLSGSYVNPEFEGSTPPDTSSSTTWINNGDHYVYIYHSWATLWLTTPLPGTDFGWAGSTITGPLKHGQVIVGDTLSTTPVGYWTPDSLYLDAINFYSRHSGAVVSACTLEVWANRKLEAPAKLFEYPIANNQIDTTDVGVFTPDSCRINVYIRSGSTNPGTPMAHLKLHKFARP